MLDKDWLLTCAPLGAFDLEKQSWRALGAGVFIYDNPFIWYVTANHIIAENSDTPLLVLINHAKEKRNLIDLGAVQKQYQINWLIDEKNDLAATLFPTNQDFMLRAIEFSFFMDSKNMLPSMICYSVGCPYNLMGFDMEKITPCVLDGIISGIDPKEGRVYVTVPTFPGNSGGPLFIWKQPIAPNGSLNLTTPVVYLGGIISQYAVVSNGSQPNHDNSPSLHLGIVIPSEAIQRLLTSSASQILKEKVKSPALK